MIFMILCFHFRSYYACRHCFTKGRFSLLLSTPSLFTPSSIHLPPFPSLLHSSPSSSSPPPSLHPPPLHFFIPSSFHLLTESPNWHHGGIEKAILCQDCRLYFQRYGCMKPLKGVWGVCVCVRMGEVMWGGLTGILISILPCILTWILTSRL